MDASAASGRSQANGLEANAHAFSRCLRRSGDYSNNVVDPTACELIAHDQIDVGRTRAGGRRKLRPRALAVARRRGVWGVGGSTRRGPMKASFPPLIARSHVERTRFDCRYELSFFRQFDLARAARRRQGRGAPPETSTAPWESTPGRSCRAIWSKVTTLCTGFGCRPERVGARWACSTADGLVDLCRGACRAAQSDVGR